MCAGIGYDRFQLLGGWHGTSVNAKVWSRCDVRRGCLSSCNPSEYRAVHVPSGTSSLDRRTSPV